MKDVCLLIARLISGLLVAGHGAQKWFGWFEGPGWPRMLPRQSRKES
jgi:putative oxidoreductase